MVVVIGEHELVNTDGNGDGDGDVLDSEISFRNEARSSLVPGGGPRIIVTILTRCFSVFGTRAKGTTEFCSTMMSEAVRVTVTR